MGITYGFIGTSVWGLFIGDIWAFLIVSCSFGALSAGATLVSFVLSAEFIDIAWGFQQVVIPVFIYYFGRWRYLFLLSLALILIYLACMWNMNESPRYLYTKGRYHKMMETLSNVAKLNKKRMFSQPIEGNFHDLDNPRVGIVEKTVPKQSKTYNCFHLLTYKSLRRNTLICCVEWFIVSFSYFGTAFILPMLDADIYLLGAMAGTAQVLGVILTGWALERIGRKTCFMAALFPAALCYLVLSITESQEVLMIFLTFAKFFISSAFCSIYLLSPEAFPTIIRSTASGVCSVVARIGGMAAPVSLFFGESLQINPIIFFAVSCLLGAALSIYLPETRGLQVSDDIEEETKPSNISMVPLKDKYGKHT
eukprot:CAMPEP_0115040234 /NCGR_PEP_ID=MMETSP0216-20121206/44663_1 /TAXON_ID=223996 /ORGANISM="Protocruzia adherens, Strain Boccale" /LENGTH=365 /DNA_ID=CAMNT_0002421347 /DNA_START=179 /DNA_END=1276 /DNA_ORIENTATION=+